MNKLKYTLLIYIVYKNMDLIGNVVTVLSLIKYTYQGFNYLFLSNNKTEIDDINENNVNDSDITIDDISKVSESLSLKNDKLNYNDVMCELNERFNNDENLKISKSICIPLDTKSNKNKFSNNSNRKKHKSKK